MTECSLKLGYVAEDETRAAEVHKAILAVLHQSAIRITSDRFEIVATGTRTERRPSFA